MYKRVGNYKIGFKYIDLEKKTKVSNEKILKWIKDIKIPPAYNNVIISKNRNSKILAYGYDSKGRKQCIYHPKFVLYRSKQKYEKILKFHSVFQSIRKQINKDIYRNDDYKIKEIAIIIFFIINCGFRIGNKKYEKTNNSYGVTTIKFKHLVFSKKYLKIDFIGKKGVQNIGICNEKEIYKYLYNKSKQYDINDNVFTNITSNDVNIYLKQWGNDISSKDLRTWNANLLFLYYIKDGLKNCIKNPMKYAIEKVAEKLHNTASVCKKNYIDPNIMLDIEEKLKNDIYIKGVFDI